MFQILVIDDERAIRSVLKDILSNEGYKVEEAIDGEDGWKKFIAANYDVVLCDIKMPKRLSNKNPELLKPILVLILGVLK